MSAVSDTPLTLLLLGDMAVARAPHAAPAQRLLAAGKPVALLAYLAAAPGRAARREELVDMLWADLEPDSARHALRQTIWYLKRRTGESLVTAAHDHVRLSPALHSDVAGFHGAVERGDHAAAVACYGGDFIPGFAAPGATGFEHWADGERHRLRSLFTRAAGHQVRALLSAASGREALALARRVRDVEPLAQHGWRLLLEASLSIGDPVVLALELERLRQLSAAEELEPDAATAALVRAAERRLSGADLERRAGGDLPPGSLVAELVGRERQFAAAIEQAERAGSGRRWLHLYAPAGFGKSRLLADLGTRLRGMKHRVRSVRARPAERDIAWSFAVDVVTTLAELPGAAGVAPSTAAALVDLAPALQETYPGAEVRSTADVVPAWRTRAMAELLTAVSDDRPLVLLVDDLHWADEESRASLTAAIDRAAGARLLAVTTARAAAAHLAPSAESVKELQLPPLEEQDVLRLVLSLGELPLEAWSSGFPALLTAASGGSPLLALETLQLAMDRGLLVLAERRWHSRRPDELATLLDDGGPLVRRLATLPQDERRGLVLVAAAGAPIAHATLAAAWTGAPDTLDAALGALERRGLARRDRTMWTVGHDEVTAGLHATHGDELVRAGATIARALVAAGPTDDRTLLRAARLLVAAGDRAPLGDVVRDWVGRQRARGRRDPTGALVRELVGDVDTGLLRALVAEVPWPRRVLGSRGGRAAVAAASLLLLLPIGLMAAPLLRDPPDAIIAVHAVDENGTQVVLGGEIRLDEWRSSEPLIAGEPLTGPRADVSFVADPSGGVRGIRADNYSDSGAIDLVLVRKDGGEERLTEAKGDDYAPSFSPDGSFFSFSTDQYREDYLTDIAVMDMERRTVRQLTSGDGKDSYPRWSPDGSRIAFMRKWSDGRPDQLCWVTFDGSLEHCATTLGPELHAILGWRDGGTLVIAADRGAYQMVAVVTADGAVLDSIGPRGQLPIVLQTSAYHAVGVASPQGRELVLVAHDRPEAVRTIRLPHGTTALHASVFETQPASGMIRSLRIQPAAGAIAVASRFKLVVRAEDQDGRAMTPPLVQWSTSDTTIARADSSGVLVTSDTGVVTVYASAGGWRRASMPVRVREGKRPHTLVGERWVAATPGAPWRLFGVPLPRLVRPAGGPGGPRVLHLMGDGIFASGLYHEVPLSAVGGLGAEAVVSVPITGTRWQSAYLALASAGSDEHEIQRWAGSTEVLPVNALAIACSIGYPVGENRVARARFSASSMGVETIHPADSTHWSGRPMRWRVQILEDGRCGVAIDGRVAMVGRVKLPLDQPWHLWLHGNSVDTDVTVHSIEIWQGVRPDIEWRVPPTPSRSTTR